MAEELSFILIYSQFETCFRHKPPGKGRFVYCLLQTNKMNRKPGLSIVKFSSSEITESPFEGEFKNHADTQY